jgi:hypothetical protein
MEHRNSMHDPSTKIFASACPKESNLDLPFFKEKIELKIKMIREADEEEVGGQRWRQRRPWKKPRGGMR